MVAAAPPRRTVQDRQRRLDRVDQRKLLSSGELGRLCARRRAPSDRLSGPRRGAALIQPYRAEAPCRAPAMLRSIVGLDPGHFGPLERQISDQTLLAEDKPEDWLAHDGAV